MGINTVLAALAVASFFLAAIGEDRGKGVPIGLLLLTLVVVF